HAMLRGVDHLALRLRVAAPQQEHQVLALAIEHFDDVVGETFPTLALVRARAAFLDRQHRVEQQHTLFGPMRQAPMRGARDPEIAMQFLEDVLQRRRHRGAVLHGETQAMRLPEPVVRILAEHDDLHLVEGRGIQRREDLGHRWEYVRALPDALTEERAQLLHVLALQVIADARLPTRLQADAVRARGRRRFAHASRLRCSGSFATRSWNRVLVTSRRSSIGLSTRSLAPSRNRLLWFSLFSSPVITSTGNWRLP